MYRELLSAELAERIEAASGGRPVGEIRLRAGFACVLKVDGRRVQTDYAVTRADLDYALGVASGFSIYAVNDTLVKGFLHYRGGVRIGVAGEGVTDGTRLVTVKNVSSLVLRIPHEILGFADVVTQSFSGEPQNTLVISPVGAGKTTLLRDMARQTSDAGANVLVIDERYELTGTVDGAATLDVGKNTDVVAGVGKRIAYENTIRSMAPDVIVTDELFSADDVAIVTDCVRSGVKVFASVHAHDADTLRKSDVFAPLFKVFSCAVTLSAVPRVGTISEIRRW